MLRVENLPLDDGPKWKIRLVSNQMKPGLMNYVAQLTKTRPIINAEPDSAEDSDVKAAQMAESLYDYLWDDLKLQSKLVSGLMEAGISGGFWCITWDSLAGKPLTFVQDPTGKPITDSDLASLFVSNLSDNLQAQSQGLLDEGQADQLANELAKKTVYLGDIRVQVCTAENVLLDPVAMSFDQCNWAIIKYALDPDEVKARWGVSVEPNAVKSADTPAPIPYVEDKKPPAALREVFVMYIRPNPALPEGRYVAWIEGPDKILQDLKWPFPHRELPLVKLPSTYRPNSPYDDPICTEARGLQKDINKTLSQIVEHKNITVRPQMLAPVGSLRGKLTSEPGAIFEYNPVNNLIPEWRPMPPIPPYIFEHLQNLQTRIDTVFNRMPSTRDQLPPRTDTGTVLEGMMEAVADQLSTTIISLEDALARAGHIMASLAQKFYTEPRLIKVRGSGGSIQVKKFMGADIAGGFTFRPRYGTGLPRTRAGRQQAILELMQSQLIDPTTALKHLDLADLKGVQATLAADEDQALREHEKLLKGQPINQAAIAQAQQQAQMMWQQAQAGQLVQDPNTGQPIDPQVLPQTLQQMLQQAAYQPTDYENWDTHLSVHGQFMKTQEFESLPPDVQQAFLTHFQATFQKVIEIRKAQIAFDPKVKPKIDIRAQTTMSAEVLGEVLREQGIQVTDQDVAQPPLDSWVLQDTSKPVMAETGNTHLDQIQQAQEIQQAQDAHLLNQAKVAQLMGQQEDTHALTRAKNLQQLRLASDQGLTQKLQAQQQMQHAEQNQQQQMQQSAQQHQQSLQQSAQQNQSKIDLAKKQAAQRAAGGEKRRKG